jgi:hypothetical protein
VTLEIGVAEAERAQPARDAPAGMIGDEQDGRARMRVLHRHGLGFVGSQQPIHDVTQWSVQIRLDCNPTLLVQRAARGESLKSINPPG